MIHPLDTFFQHTSSSFILQQLYVFQHNGTCLLMVVLMAGLDKDCRLTEPLGMRIAEFPLNPMFAKMLLESVGWRPTVLIDFILSVRGVISLNSMHPGEEGSIYLGE